LSDSGGLLVAGYDRVVLEEARRAVERCTEAGGNDPVQHGGAAFAAIVLAVAAAEIQYDERLASYQWSGPLSPADGAAIQGEDHLWSRIRALIKTLAGSELDLAQPQLYQQFIALVKLRHALVHRSAQYLDTEDWPEGLKSCVDHIPYKRGGGLDWTSRVLCDEVAEWAVETSERLLVLVQAGVPLPPGLRVAVKPVVIESSVVEPPPPKLG